MSDRGSIIHLLEHLLHQNERGWNNFSKFRVIKNFCPAGFDSFEVIPSVGASGGILVAWKSDAFWGVRVFDNRFALSMEFTSKLDNETWMLTTVYAPCTPDGKREFLNWFKNIEMPSDIDWLVVGDFNLMRKPEDRNREGADLNEIFLFNEAINKLDMIELPLHGRQFTWTNKQFPPLLERLDWFFYLKLLDCKVPRYHCQNPGNGNL